MVWPSDVTIRTSAADARTASRSAYKAVDFILLQIFRALPQAPCSILLNLSKRQGLAKRP
jgi:hypothetical protein